MKTLYTALLLLPALTAQADTVIHPVSWWMAHPAELRQVLAACHDNGAYARTATCGNAEAAASGLQARNPPDLASLLKDPRYWSANPIARAGAYAQCRAGTSTYAAECPAIARSVLQDLKSRQ